MVQRLAGVLHPVLEPVALAIQEVLLVGKLAEGLRRWHGAWLGILSAKKPATDTYNLFFSYYYPVHVAQTWLALLTETGVLAQLSEQEFATTEVARCLPVFVRAVVEPMQTPPGSPKGAGPHAALPDADMALLLAVAGNPSLAPALRDALQPYPHRLLPALQLRLAAGCRDWPAWEPLAVQLAATDPRILLELLHFYHEQHRPADLVQAAEKYFLKHKLLVAPFVLAHLTPADSPGLYAKALLWRLETNQEFTDYETLTELWTPQERAAFVLQLLAGRPVRFAPLLRARVLAAESRPAEILPLILKLDWHPRPRSSWWAAPPPEEATHLPELLTLAAHHAPEATLDAVMERTEQLLADQTRRSVELYQRIASWLKALHELPVLAEQVIMFAEGLSELYKKLTHLRRALREAQLLPEPEPTPPRPGRPTPPKPGRKPKNPFGR